MEKNEYTKNVDLHYGIDDDIPDGDLEMALLEIGQQAIDAIYASTQELAVVTPRMIYSAALYKVRSICEEVMA